jgi:hypothetical protein
VPGAAGRAGGDETDVLAVGLGPGAKPKLGCPLAHLRLGQLTDRQVQRGARTLVQHRQHVGLILRLVSPSADAHLRARPHDPGVVPGGDRVEAEALGAGEEGVELQVAIALDTGIRRRPAACSLA